MSTAKHIDCPNPYCPCNGRGEIKGKPCPHTRCEDCDDFAVVQSDDGELPSWQFCAEHHAQFEADPDDDRHRSRGDDHLYEEQAYVRGMPVRLDMP